MKASLLHLLGGLLFAVAIPVVTGRAEVFSEAEGVLIGKLDAGTTQDVGDALTRRPVFAGFVNAVSSSSLALGRDAWATGEFAQHGRPFRVRMTSGQQEGRQFEVTGNSASRVELAVDDVPLTSAGFSVLAGDRFEIFPLDTLGLRFGATVAELRLQGADIAAGADLVSLYEQGAWVAYFFNTSVTPNRWVRSSDPNGNWNDRLLGPETGMLITRRGAATELAFGGRVPPTQLRVRLPGNASSFLANPFPLDTTLDALVPGPSGRWQRGGQAGAADSIARWNQTEFETFFQRPEGGWRNAKLPDGLSVSPVLPATSGLMFRKVGAASGVDSMVTWGLPYPSPLMVAAGVSVPAAADAPVLAIAGGLKVQTSKPTFVLRGVATARSGIARIEYRLGAVAARIVLPGTRWSLRLKLKTGRNVVQLYAVSAAGQRSKTVTVVITRK